MGVNSMVAYCARTKIKALLLYAKNVLQWTCTKDKNPKKRTNRINLLVFLENDLLSNILEDGLIVEFTEKYNIYIYDELGCGARWSFCASFLLKPFI